MPPKKTNAASGNGFAQQFGQRLQKAHQAHAADETDYGNLGDLPAGISGGVAQLTDARLDKYKDGTSLAGQWYFYAAGVVVTPKEFEGQRTEGMRTSIIEPLCDTPSRSRKTLEDHMGWVYNELRKLGLDTRHIDPNNLEKEIAALKLAAPYFRFRTWKGQVQTTGPYAGKDPRVNHDWNGILPDFVPPEGGTSVADNTEIVEQGAVEEHAEVEEVVEHTEVDVNGSNGETVATEQDVDLEALANDADNGKSKTATKSQEQLTTLCEAHGVTEEQMNAAPNWKAVSELIAVAMSEGAAVEDENGAEAVEGPAVGDVCQYKPKNPKNPKVRLPAVKCEIVEIALDGSVVKLKNLANQKVTYPNVPMDELDFS